MTKSNPEMKRNEEQDTLLNLLRDTNESPKPCLIYIDKLLETFDYLVSNYEQVHIYTKITNKITPHTIFEEITIKKILELENQLDELIEKLETKSNTFKDIKKTYFLKKQNIKKKILLLSF